MGQRRGQHRSSPDLTRSAPQCCSRIIRHQHPNRAAAAWVLPPNTLAELQRELEHLRFIKQQIKQIEQARLQQLEQTPQQALNATRRDLLRVRSVGIETADLLTSEVFTREYRDQRAIARYVGLTGSPDESGSRRREKGLAKAGNARVRH